MFKVMSLLAAALCVVFLSGCGPGAFKSAGEVADSISSSVSDSSDGDVNDATSDDTTTTDDTTTDDTTTDDTSGSSLTDLTDTTTD